MPSVSVILVLLLLTVQLTVPTTEGDGRIEVSFEREKDRIRFLDISVPLLDEYGEWSVRFEPVLISTDDGVGLSDGGMYEIVVDPDPGSPMIPWIATTITTGYDITGIREISRGSIEIPAPEGIGTIPRPSGHWELEDDYGSWSGDDIYPLKRIRYEPIGYRMVDGGLERTYSLWYTPFTLNSDGTSSVEMEPELEIEYSSSMSPPEPTRASGDPSLVPGTLSISSMIDVPPEYIIITSRGNMDEIQPLVDWRNRKGLATSLIDIGHIIGNYSGSDDLADLLREYIKDVHYGWGRLRYVMLAGDWTSIPVKYVLDSDPSSWDDGWIPADSYFQCLDGTWDLNGNGIFGEPGDIEDLIPDVIVSRLAIDDGATWEKKVMQIIEYESGGSLDQWTDKGVLLGAHTHNEGDGSHYSEYLWDKYLTSTYSDKVTLYEDDGTLTNSAIEDQITEGASFIQFVDHGGPNEWCDDYGAGVVYRSRDARGLTNGEKAPFISALACLTTWFDDTSGCPYGNWENCLGEAFTENPNGGAMGYVGSSRVSVGIINTNRYLPYDNGLIEDIARQVGGIGTFTTGDIHTGAKAHYAEVWGSRFSNANNPEVGLCWLEFTLLGEPACDLWTGAGDQMIADVEHEDDLDPHITVTVTDEQGVAIEGANVSLQNFERKVFHRAVTDVDGKAVFDLVLDWFCDINLTITKHNLKPYSGSIRISDVIPPVTTMITDPPSPDGSNGWFITSPEVSLIPNERAVVHYRIGTGPDLVLNKTMNFTIPSIPEGEVDIHFFAVDEASNLEVERHITIRTDLKDPSLEVVLTPEEPDGENGYYISEPLVTMAEDENDRGSPVTYKYTLDGEEFDYTNPFYLEEGDHLLKVTAIDASGRSSNSTTVEVNVDMKPPSTELFVEPDEVDGENGWYSSTPRVRLIPSELFCIIEYRFTQTGPFIPYEGEISLPDGRYYLEYRSIDRSGNVESTGKRLFMVDTEDPLLDHRLTPVEPDGDQGYYRTSPRLSFQWTDEHDTSIMVSINGGIWENWTGSRRLEDGTHDIEAFAIDGAGRTSEVTSFQVKVDTTAPPTHIEEAGVSSGGWFTTIPTLSLFTDEEAATFYSWSDRPGYSLYSEPISPRVEEGTVTLTYYSQDIAGNTGPERSITYRVDIRKPDPVVSYEVDKRVLEVDAGRSTDGTDLLFRFIIDGKVVGDWSRESTIKIELEPGPHQLEVDVKDSAGNTAATTMIVDVPNSGLWMIAVGGISLVILIVVIIALLFRRRRPERKYFFNDGHIHTEESLRKNRDKIVVAEIEEID